MALTIIPVLLFVLAEVALRVVGYGYPTSIAVRYEVNGMPSCCSNPKFAWRFFPPTIARAVNAFTFGAEKSPQTYRIFVVGASAAAGIPEGDYTFGRMLEVMLGRQYPQCDFEVINTAMPAINSHVVREIVSDCRRFQPDLFVVYLGNNEVVGPYGAGTIFAPLSSSTALIRLGIAAKGTKLGQLIGNLLASAGGAPVVWLGMEMFLEQQVRASDPALQTVYDHYRQNLEDIRRMALSSGAQVIFCTVPVNLKDNPPFASLHRADLAEAESRQWSDFYESGVAAQTDGRYGEAVTCYLDAARIDDRHADLHFRLGSCLWAIGRYDEARERYVLARELDTLRFRADARINEIVREVAAKPNGDGTYLVDAEKAFGENSPHGTPGEELFYEHVHMNFTGAHLLATGLFEQVDAILPDSLTQGADVDALPLSQADCARYLAYTQWDRSDIAETMLRSFFTRPPFTNQLDHEEFLDRRMQQARQLQASLDTEALRGVSGQYQWAIEQRPSDWWLRWKYALFLQKTGNTGAAAEQYRRSLDSAPHNYEAHAKLGLLAGQSGDLRRAIEHNLRALEFYPVFGEAHFNLGFAYHMQYQIDKSSELLDKARRQYIEAIRCQPDEPRPYQNLALIQRQEKQDRQAEETLRRGLSYAPDSPALHYNLGVMLHDLGRVDEAIEEYRTTLRVDPNYAPAGEMLRRITGGN
jgi:tetratricopeptide (TPR) repeat protein